MTRRCTLRQAHEGPHLFVDSSPRVRPLLGDCLSTGEHKPTLSAREQIFIEEVFMTRGNANPSRYGDGAKAAGYQDWRSMSVRLMRSPKIAAALQTLHTTAIAHQLVRDALAILDADLDRAQDAAIGTPHSPQHPPEIQAWTTAARAYLAQVDGEER